MKILVITPIYYIDGRKNLFHDSSAIHYLIRPWASNHDVVIIHIYSQSSKEIVRYFSKQERQYYQNGYRFTINNVRVFMCEIQRWPKQRPILDRRQSKRVSSYMNRILKEIAFEPDIIVTHIPTCSLGVLPSITSSARKVAVLHSSDVANVNARRKLLDLLSSNYDCVFSRSKAIYDFFYNKGLKNLSREIVTSGVQNLPKLERNYFQKDRIHFLYVGKLIKRKHIDLVIESLGQLQENNIYFTVIGSGQEETNLKQLAEKHLLRSCYEFLGNRPIDEVLLAMMESDVFIMPSTEETFGLAYLEAMSRGCIPIGTQGEGIDGIIIDTENGFLVQPNDLESLMQIIRKILQMEMSEFLRIADNAHNTAIKYDEQTIGLKYLALITSGYV